MAIQCGRCGAVNPDGNQFCQTCGTPLAGGVPGILPSAPPPPGPPQGPPQGPPVAYASPPPAPMGYQSPYYAPSPTAPQPPVHRTPWILIVSGVVILVVLMAGCGTAIALFGRNNLTVSGGVTGDLPSPSPAGSPSPLPTPTAAGGLLTTSNGAVALPAPQGWTPSNPDSETIALVSPNTDGEVNIGSGTNNPKMSAQEFKGVLDQDFRNQGEYLNTEVCPNTQTTARTIAGAAGLSWTLCFTYTPPSSSGGQSFPAVAQLFAGANADGSAYYLVIVFTSRDNLGAFVAEAAPVLQSIQWKLK